MVPSTATRPGLVPEIALLAAGLWLLAPTAAAAAQEPSERPEADRAGQEAGAPEAGAPPRVALEDPDRAELARRIEGLLDDPALERAHVGLLAQVGETGEVAFARNAEKLFVSASTAKLVTAAAALRRLGPDHRWLTRLLAAGALRSDTLHGDLWIVGGGDPRLEPEEVIRWPRLLREAGIRHVTGDVVGDDRYFEGPVWGRGWTWEDVHSGWGAGVSGLQLSPARVRAELVPGSGVGAPATLRFRDPGPKPPVRSRVRTGPHGGEVRIRFLPPPEGGPVEIVGWIPAGAGPVSLSLAPHHPTLHLLARLETAMRDAGVGLGGGFRRARPDEEIGGPVDWQREIESEPLEEVIEHLLRWSDNQVAESLLRTLGREAGGTGAPEEGLEAVQEVVAGWGIEPGAVQLADGSGLSRYSRVTPAALVRLLRRVAQLPEYDVLREALPVAAESGTLGRRLAATAAEGNARAKTGSLGGVRGLAGYVTDADGETIVFALLLNGYEVPGDVATGLEDLLVEQLALYHSDDYPGCPCPRRR